MVAETENGWSCGSVGLKGDVSGDVFAGMGYLPRKVDIVSALCFRER